MLTHQSIAGEMLQGIVDDLDLCHRNDDDSLRKRNILGAYMWGIFTAGTDCDCCRGYRFLLLLCLIPMAALAGYMAGRY
jgi:hypothetical protein